MVERLRTLWSRVRYLTLDNAHFVVTSIRKKLGTNHGRKLVEAETVTRGSSLFIRLSFFFFPFFTRFFPLKVAKGRRALPACSWKTAWVFLNESISPGKMLQEYPPEASANIFLQRRSH